MLKFEIVSEDEIDQRLRVEVGAGRGGLKVGRVPDTYVDIYPRISWQEQLALRQKPEWQKSPGWEGKPTHSRFTLPGNLSQEHVDFGIAIAQELIPSRHLWLAHLVINRPDESQSFWVPPAALMLAKTAD